MAQTQHDSVALPPRLPLVVTTNNRSNSVDKDSRLINCFIEVDKNTNELSIFKRPGLLKAASVVTNRQGLGIYYWNGHVYSVWEEILYEDTTQISNEMDDTHGPYRFDSILGATPKLLLGNGYHAYSYYNDGTMHLSADLHTINVEYPEITVKGFSYLNGYTYVMQPGAVIWQSALNSVDHVGDWSAIAYIGAHIEPDNGVFLSKQLVYVVALKQWTIEYFFDAGNTTGSSLGAVQGMKVSYGCAHQDSVVKINDVLFFLSQDQNASLQVSRLEQGAHTIVSTPAIDRLLDGIDTTTIYSWQLKINGHSFYIITFKEADLTLVYDITQDLWSQWTDKDGHYFPIVASTYDAQGRHVVQHENDGCLYYMSSDYHTDDGAPIVSDIITPLYDAGTYRRKQMKMIKLVADQQSGDLLKIRHSDNDYGNWSNWRTFNLGHRQPLLTNCGTFVKRAYQLRHDTPFPMRIRALEVQIDIGTL